MFSKSIFFLIGLMLLILPCNAQQSNDAGMWATLSIQHALSKKVNFVIDQEFRARENYQRINLFYTNIGVDYKMYKFLKISPTFRTIQKKRLDGSYSYRHRLMLDVSLKVNLLSFLLEFMFREIVE